jgi:isocitrate dehydrogenase kinase/phosphatase
MKTWTKGIVAGLLAGVVILGSLPAVAGPYVSYLDQRQMNQERRIYQGVRSGQVTPGEFRRMENQQGRIRAAEGRMRADGHLNRYERARLNRMENRASHDIYRYKHNNFVQANYRPANWRPAWR